MTDEETEIYSVVACDARRFLRMRRRIQAGGIGGDAGNTAEYIYYRLFAVV